MKTITVIKSSLHKLAPSANSVVVTYDVLYNWVKKGTFIKHLFQYQKAELLTYRLEAITRPLLDTALLWLLSWGNSWIKDEHGKCIKITWNILTESLRQALVGLSQKKTLIHRINTDITRLGMTSIVKKQQKRKLDLSAPSIYLRTDFYYGTRSGGSVGHIAGVLNLLDEFTGRPVFFTTDFTPTVRKDIDFHLIVPSQDGFWNFRELPSLSFTDVYVQKVRKYMKDSHVSFIYQRYSLNNYAGVKLAEHFGVPFVLEYNGSEVWMRRNWDRPLKHEILSERIELLNLHAADVVVVVSRPMLDELTARGIDANKILVNPNGVDTNRYSSLVNGTHIREKYCTVGKTVVGFIGTFGRWHGADILVEAFGRLIQHFSGLRNHVRLFMIGDGEGMPLVKQKQSEFNIADICILTGLVPQEDGPAHLAACDILVSPHVPNPDGTPFFGSPTKLFEYMAMGKGIVASDLEQIGEILEHDRTAWLVQPGNIEALKEGLKVLIDDIERRSRLGRTARKEVIDKYTWQQHTQKIIQKLKERCS